MRATRSYHITETLPLHIYLFEKCFTHYFVRTKVDAVSKHSDDKYLTGVISFWYKNLLPGTVETIDEILSFNRPCLHSIYNFNSFPVLYSIMKEWHNLQRNEKYESMGKIPASNTIFYSCWNFKRLVKITLKSFFGIMRFDSVVKLEFNGERWDH